MHAMRWLGLMLALALLAGIPVLAQQDATAVAPKDNSDFRAWPHTYDVDGLHLVLHHPQIDSWVNGQLKARLAVAVKTGAQVGSDGKQHDVMTYGVAWVTARTETDKVLRQVELSKVSVDKVSFPTAPSQEPRYLEVLRGIAARSHQVASLDTLEASLAISKQENDVKNLPVKNDPPQVIFSFKPALLVLIDGAPASKPSGVAGVNRIVNTRSLVLQQGQQYFVTFAGKWVSSATLDGPWMPMKTPPAAVAKAARAAVQAKQVDTLDNPSDALKKVLDAGQLPDLVVRTQPSELIMVDGEPQFDAIAGTQLAYVANTASDVFVDQAHGLTWYVLVSGRWFTAESTNGPWRYVAGESLPADFANIPSDSPKSAVLASIPGTPEARESLIANSVPQTATVDGHTATLHLSYDGAPQFRPIDGTALSYAWNTDVPVIRVDASAYYAVQNGVWFTAGSPSGPWAVAMEVPSVIYSIPPSSPLHYVTYVYVYGHEGNQVYVGYSPGYYGTVVSDGVVVYGTGYTCNPWVGNDIWYGCPATYGFGVSFGWTPWAGWGFGYAWGWAWASAWYGPWWGPWGYYPGYYPGYWGGAIAAANVYGRWGNAVVSGRVAGWANPWTGNIGRAGRGGYYNEATGGRGVGYAGRNTNIYTGTTTATAGGIRYNPQTGRVVAGQGAAAVNPYTGNAVAGGQRTVANTNTGRVTQQAGVAGRTDQGAGAAGAFNSQGAGGDARGAGYVHYDKASGDVSRGGVVDINDQVYAGKDGNVYRYDKDQGWQKVDNKGGFNRVNGPDSVDTDRDRMARDRGADSASFQQREDRPQPQRQQFDRSNYNNRYHGQMGGFRPSMGGGRFGGGRMGGGFRR
ncbi:MAG TPA: hypothetical protein VFG49_02285 [Dyella sp.]|uniref:hypothetical protein n=1 Tax=Dyella sp. TaxID=1869338 RepID=UPI002D774F2A|nr:hypothetical protein [Dyella sp.]HET6552341.1 hypothetical protein [Dyella sp.]